MPSLVSCENQICPIAQGLDLPLLYCRLQDKPSLLPCLCL